MVGLSIATYLILTLSPQALKKEKENCHWCQLRALPTHKEYPVSIVNDREDGVIIPSHFRFLQHSILGTGVAQAEDSFRSGCECIDGEDCQYSSCLCLQEQDDEEEEDDDDDDHDDEGSGGMRDVSMSGLVRKKVYRYHMHGVKAGLLQSKFLHSERTQPIYECHEGCDCTESCPNRVVERGRKVPLQIFRTESTGWGE